MKILVLIAFVLLLIPPVSPLVPGVSTLGVFIATSPCDAASRPVLIPASANCEMIKWNLTLFQDANTHSPTTYKLSTVYGLPEQGTNLVSNGGTRVETEGKWTVVRGAKGNPDAIVYRLDPLPGGSVSFLKVDENLLHLLDGAGSLAIGTAGWSYTLNRAGNLGRNIQQAVPVPTSPLQVASPATYASSIPTDSSMLGRFVGRSPCHEVARELGKAVNPDCMKVKWDLSLYQDPNTLKPTRYKLNGTFFRERTREGKWTIAQGTRINPNAVVYELDPDKPQGSLLLLKADDNVLFFLDKDRHLLVGNGYFSYTLNREGQ